MAETTDELLARMAKKYGLPDPAPAAQAQPAPQQPAPKPQPQPEKRGIVDTLRDRGRQIDKASGFACGGKIHRMAQGGKISGPGTPTSDSIPAEVRQTGEPIKVSTEERILSEAQDEALEAIATKMGFKSLDDWLESLTGVPVGPTVQGGQRAAATGMGPDWMRAFNPETDSTDNVDQAYRNANKPLIDAGTYLNRGDPVKDAIKGIGSFISNSANAAGQGPTWDMNTGQLNIQPSQPLAAPRTIADVARPPVAPSAVSPSSRPIAQSAPQTIASQVVTPSRDSRGSVSTIDGGDVNGILSREAAIRSQPINVAGDQGPKGGVIGDSRASDSRSFDNFLARSSLQSALDTAAKTSGRNSGQNLAAIAGALNQTANQIPGQELARDTLAQQGDIKRQELGQDARYKTGILGVQQSEAEAKNKLAGLAGIEQADKLKTNSLTRQDVQSDVDLKQMKLGLLKTLMDPNADPKAIAQAQKQFQALSGKQETQGAYEPIYKQTQDVNGSTKDIAGRFNKNTGQYEPLNGGQSQTKTIPKAAIDALRKNPDKASEFDSFYGPGASSNYLQKQ